MTRSTSWNHDSPRPRKPMGTRLWLMAGLGALAILILVLVVPGLRGSIESPRLAKRLFQEISTDDGARLLYQKSPGLQVGYGSEEVFLKHIQAWRPRFGAAQAFEGPDAAKRFLPYAAKLETQGSGGAWFAVMARLDPFPKLHGMAFGPTRELARRTCMSLYAKSHMREWLDRGLAHAHKLADASLAGGSAKLDVVDLELIRALPAQSKTLDPTAFGFQFTAGGASLDLDLSPNRTLSLRWKGDSPEAEIEAIHR